MAQGAFPSETPPVVTSKAFLPWCERLVASKVAAVPLNRSSTYYFSPDGDDATGDGSIGQPFRTIDKANSVIALSSGNVRIRFRRGGVFRAQDGILIGQRMVTADSYLAPGDPRSLAKPLLTRFEPEVQPNQWNSSGGHDTYRTAASSPVAWVKFANDPITVFRRALSEDDCRNSSGTWYWGDGILTVHAPGDCDLTNTDRRIEYVFKNQATGVWMLDVDNVRLHGLRIEGFGAGTPGDFSYRGYGIEADQSGSNRAVVTECETYYNGRHSITKVGTSAGGSLTVVRCRMGWLVNDGINIVGYSPLGGQELVSAYNEFLGCELPNGDKPYPYGGNSMPVYLHTSDDQAYRQALFLSLNDTIVSGQYQCGGLPGSNCAPSFSQLQDARSFVVGLSAEVRSQTAFDLTKPSSNGGNGLMFQNLGWPSTCYVNCKVRPTVLWTQASGDVSLCTSSYGLWINSDLTFDFHYADPSPWNRVLSVSPTSPNFSAYASSFYACRIKFIASAGGGTIGFSGPMIHRYGSFYNSLGGKWLGEMRACIIDADSVGSGAFLPGFGNDGQSMQWNAYLGVTDSSGPYGCDQDPYVVSGTASTGRPLSGTGLEMPVPIRIWNQPLEYDQQGWIRSAQPAVGPLEPYRIDAPKAPNGGSVGG
ncbi:MAG: hypothetical protein JSS66_04465 [Armatimonadetes bacterium]|nr:hypothetical protein [Armatimonadota bacterium]